MPAPSIYRYILQPYAGLTSRIMCPGCGKLRCFTRYLDTTTYELLPNEYGCCDHKLKCGYHLSPYHAGPGGGPSYSQQARLVTKPAPLPVLRRPSQQVMTPSISTLSIPTDVFKATLCRYDRNNLAQLLTRHFGGGVADELLRQFSIGTAAYWPGACVFWLIDEQGRIRGGQVVLYDETGHTVKHPRRCTAWVHTALTHDCRQRGQILPSWLEEYNKYGQKSPCLFGLPQLLTAPLDQPIAIVESAKTAMVATVYFPQFKWLATMGLSNLTADRLEPLRGRRIVLFPDAGALADWQLKAANLRNMGFMISVSDKLENMVTSAERDAGLDLADVLLSEWPGYPPIWDKKLQS